MFINLKTLASLQNPTIRRPTLSLNPPGAIVLIPRVTSLSLSLSLYIYIYICVLMCIYIYVYIYMYVYLVWSPMYRSSSTLHLRSLTRVPPLAPGLPEHPSRLDAPQSRLVTCTTSPDGFRVWGLGFRVSGLGFRGKGP